MKGGFRGVQGETYGLGIMKQKNQLFHYGENNDGYSSICVYDMANKSGFVGFSNNKNEGTQLIGKIGDEIRALMS